MTQIDSIRTDYALTFLTDTAKDSDINPDQISRCHGFVADELSNHRAEIDRLIKEKDELREPIRFILQRNRAILGGLCDDVFDDVEIQSEELTDALAKLRKWLANTEKDTG